MFGSKKGTCGENINWVLTDGTLTITGSGCIDRILSASVPQKKVRSADIRDGITGIGEYAFFGFKNMTEIRIPDSVTDIGESAFYKCGSLKKICIPAGVKSIGDKAFFGCTSLAELHIPAGVTSIGEWTFYDCKSLKEIYIPNGVESIGDKVFYGCENLTEIHIPDGVGSIGSMAFLGCGNLKTVCYSGTKTRWGTVKVGNYNECLKKAELRFEGGEASGTCGLGLKWILRDGVLTIGGTGEMSDPTQPSGRPWRDVAEKIKSIVILDGVKDIGAYAFFRCVKLTDILIPVSVKTIGKNAFKGCDRLTTIRYRGSGIEWGNIQKFGDKPWWEQDEDLAGNAVLKKAELRCEKDASGTCGEELNWTLEDGVLTVSGTGEMRFPDPRFSPWDAASAEITSAVIAEGVTDIAAYAFYHCGNLTEILIPAGVKTIGKNAFKGCDRLTTIRYRGSGIEWGNIQKFGDKPWWEQDEDLAGNAVLKKAELRCEEDASGTCGEELNWTLEDGVLTVSGTGKMRFPDPGSPPWFAAADAITGAVIADGVTDIGNCAFLLCEKLTAIRIPNSVISIGKNAFSWCESLAEIQISDGVTSIGEKAFCGCKSLAEIQIPDGVTEIGESAFCDCESLAEIHIPFGVHSIKKDAFGFCHLKTVFYSGSREQWERISIESGNDCLQEAELRCEQDAG